MGISNQLIRIRPIPLAAATIVLDFRKLPLSLNSVYRRRSVPRCWPLSPVKYWNANYTVSPFRCFHLPPPWILQAPYSAGDLKFLQFPSLRRCSRLQRPENSERCPPREKPIQSSNNLNILSTTPKLPPKNTSPNSPMGPASKPMTTEAHHQLSQKRQRLPETLLPALFKQTELRQPTWSSGIVSSRLSQLAFPSPGNKGIAARCKALEPLQGVELLREDLRFRVLLEDFPAVDQLVLAVRVVDQYALLAGALSVLRREEQAAPSLALPLVVGVVWNRPVAGVADGVRLGGAGVGLVEARPAPRADPAGLGAVMGAVGARRALAALGVAAADTAVHHAPAWTASAAVSAAFLVPDAWPGLAHLEQRQMHGRSEVSAARLARLG